MTRGRPARRTTQLVAGLAAYAFSMAMLVHAGQGAMPWDVLHQGIARRTDLSLGLVVVLASVVVLLAWIPLRQRPGVGTVANVVVIGVVLDPSIALLAAWLPDPSVAVRVALAVAAVVLNGVATAAYLGTRLGPGPRDGLMTGLVARTGWSVRVVKTSIEIGVVAAGWVLGGTLGWATVLYALGVGAVVQVAAPRLVTLPATHPPVPGDPQVAAARASCVDVRTGASAGPSRPSWPGRARPRRRGSRRSAPSARRG
ncbi:hypothetical protein [Oerskovia flava]|uniref:membrane protein YczE n=1 Tax=Oerskovia flava TaxID=2986422 RepID=UPI002AD2D1BA|nr:hypothetical protein [Oerskovia sp. JB1-3-2]